MDWPQNNHKITIELQSIQTIAFIANSCFIILLIPSAKRVLNTEFVSVDITHGFFDLESLKAFICEANVFVRKVYRGLI